ncbi:phage holin family protein [Streptomyces alfalfae]|nr:phage holin family protein [Streptomyces fradiae]RXX36208.1 phage holin family protein [Streptomyces alfalfae]RZM96455.1 phage holin family protein [Streptomyces alfalfae]THC49076.1 phage holin family protein [Streptomyces sp. A1499]
MDERPAHEQAQHSVGELIERATTQLSDLVRQEMRLAGREMAEKGKRAGRGGGLLGAAGAVSYIGLMALAATAVAALSLALPVWASALIVTGVLFAVAGVLAVMGRGQLARAVPPTPQEAMDSVKADVEEIKERAHR